jgi:hypothetical protein
MDITKGFIGYLIPIPRRSSVNKVFGNLSGEQQGRAHKKQEQENDSSLCHM